MVLPPVPRQVVRSMRSPSECGLTLHKMCSAFFFGNMSSSEADIWRRQVMYENPIVGKRHIIGGQVTMSRY